MNCIGSGAVNRIKIISLTLIIIFEAATGVLTGRYVAQTLSLSSIPLWRAIYAPLLVIVNLFVVALAVYALVVEQRNKK